MSAPVVAVIVVTAALWPFGRGAEERRGEPTIGSLETREVEIRRDQSLPASGDLAREHYREFLRLEGADPEMTAEALRRLADLALESEEQVQLELGAETLSGETHAEAVELYQERLTRFPDHPLNDRVRYQLARAQELAGDRLAALETLDELIARHPASELAAEVQFRRGELLFSAGRYNEAEPAYAAVLADPLASEWRLQAAYKHGWSLFKLGWLPETLAAFFDLLASQSRGVAVDLEALPRAQRELLEDVLRVMALALVGQDGVRTLRAQLDADPARAPWSAATHRALAGLYLEQERYSDTWEVSRAFVRHSPLDREAPALALEGMEALRRGGFPGLLLEAKEDFVGNFGLDTPFWQVHAQATQPDTVAALASALTTLARHHHALSQQPEPPAGALAQAIRWYGLLLDYFPAADEAPEHHFLLAELLLEAGDLPASVRAFEATAYGYPTHARSAEAGYAGLLARDVQLAAAGSDPTLALEYLSAAERFAGTFPGHERTLEVLTDAAERAFALEQAPQALRLARAVTRHPTAVEPRLARVAWRIEGHVLFDLFSYAEAETAYWQVHALVSPEARPEVEARLAASIYRQGELAREDGQHEIAAGHFLRVGERLPQAEIRPVADFDAGVSLLAAGQWQRAVDVFSAFRQRHPGHPLAAQVEINLASAFESLDRPAAAAEEYTRMAARLPANDEQRALLWRTAELQERAGDVAATEAVLERIAREHAAAFDEALEARQQLLEMAEARGERQLALQRAESLVAFETTGARTPRSLELAARAALRLAEERAGHFHATPLVVPLADSLRVKRARMEAALDGFARAAAFGLDEVVTASTYGTAELYHGLARALMDSPRPAELDEFALEQYEMLLEEQAFPFEEQAIEIHARNAARSAEGLYDRWVAASFEQLARLLPARYAKSEQGETHVARLY